MSYALGGEDLYAFESTGIQSVFTEAELADFRSRTREELLPRLGEIRLTWESNSDGDPDSHLRPLLDAFSALKGEFADEPDIVAAIDQEIERGEEWIAENGAEDPDAERSSRTFGEIGASDRAAKRIIFDDVDE